MPSEGHEAAASDDALLHRAVDKISAMLAYWDASKRCRFANRAYERWFGVSPEALIGKHISELLGPLYPRNLPYIEAALRGEPQEFEREIPDPAGGPPRHSLASYIPDVVDGVVQGFFVLVSEVSDLKRAELALKESEARFSGIIAIAADAIISIDEERRITIFNAGAEKIFGYTRSEAIGARLDMLIPERLRAAHDRHLAAFATGDTTARQMGERQMSILALRKTGEEFPAEAAISKLELGGRIVLTVALRDITERKRIEMEQAVLAEAGAVLASSLDYEQTLQSIAQLVVRHAADLCVIDMLEEDASLRRLTVAHADPAKRGACEQLAALGLDRRHVLGRTALETGQPQLFRELTPEFIETTARDAEHLRLLLELAPRSAIAVPLQAAGGVVGALVLASSRPGRYGEHDLPFLTELARRAALAIENARLYGAAQRATQARDDALAIVAHDVRSPLHTIALATQALQRQAATCDDAKVARSVEVIVRSVERANRLIEDLLDISRIEAGAMALARQAVGARQVVSDAVASQELRASAASIDLRLDAEAELPEIWADHDRMLQVLENLVGNALKFTPAGGRIRVTARRVDGAVVFAVEDTGPGIPAEHLPHVFDRFWQARRSERRGAGLGLPICKGIVEAHDGRIWAESTPGRGTTFSFTIPSVARGEAWPEPPSAPGA